MQFGNLNYFLPCFSLDVYIIVYVPIVSLQIFQIYDCTIDSTCWMFEIDCYFTKQSGNILLGSLNMNNPIPAEELSGCQKEITIFKAG